MTEPIERPEDWACKKLQRSENLVLRRATEQAFGAHIHRFAETSTLDDTHEPWGVIDLERGRVFLAFDRVGDLMGETMPHEIDWQALFAYWRRANLCVPGIVAEMAYPPAFPPQPGVCFYLKPWVCIVKKSLMATDGEDA